jgi:MFS family permease
MEPDPVVPLSDDELRPPKGALLAIFAVVLVDMLGFGLMIPLLPFYARQFDASPLQVTLLFSIFSICQFVATPLLGAWSDRVGRRPVLAISLIGSAVGYALLGWATQHQWTNLALGLAMVYLSRIVDGLTAGNISTAQAYISDVTTAANRTKGMGILGAAFGFGFSLGPAMGMVLAARFSLATPAWVACGLALGAATLSLVLIGESRRHIPTKTGNYLNVRQFAPLFANRPLMRVNVAWFVAMASFVATDSAIVMFLSDIFHFTKRDVAEYFILVGVVILITQGGLVGRLNRKFGEWSLCISGITISAVGGLFTAATVWHPVTWLLFTGAVIVAFGRSLFQPTISALASHHSDPRQQGLSFGFFQGIGTLARVMGPILAGFAYERHVTWPWFFAGAMLIFTALWLGSLRVQERRQGIPTTAAERSSAGR